MAGHKERIIEVLEHREPESIPFGEVHISKKFIEKYTGKTYMDPSVEIDFSLEIGRDLIKPEAFWFGTKLKDQNGKPFPSSKALLEYASRLPLGISQEMKDKLRKTKKQCDDKNLLLVVQLAGVLSYAWSMIPFEDFLVDLMLEPEEAHKIITLIVRRNTVYAQELAELGIEAVLLTDDIAGNDGLLISPEKFREAIKPAMKQIIDSCGDMYIIFHSDGNIDPVLSDLIELGIDAFQSIEYGKMDLKQTKEKYPGLALFGNVDVSVMHTGTPDEIEKLVKEAIAIGSLGGNYAVCSDNSIPPFISIQNFNAYVEAIKKYTGGK